MVYWQVNEYSSLKDSVLYSWGELNTGSFFLRLGGLCFITFTVLGAPIAAASFNPSKVRRIYLENKEKNPCPILSLISDNFEKRMRWKNIFRRNFRSCMCLDSYFLSSFHYVGSLEIRAIRGNWNTTSGFHHRLAHLSGEFSVPWTKFITIYMHKV